MKATYILAFSLAAYQMVAGEFNLMLFAFGYTFFGMFFSILLNTIKESKKLEEEAKEEKKPAARRKRTVKKEEQEG